MKETSYFRVRSGSSVKNEENTLNDILNQTLQKLKRRPNKMTGRLAPITAQVQGADLNYLQKITNFETFEELNIDELT